MAAFLTNPLAAGLFVLAALVALVCLLYGVRELQLANHVLRSTPHSVLETTRGGPVELRGKATPATGVLRSPLTDTPCLAYEYEVEEEYSTKNGSSWRTIDSGDRSVPFRLEDDSGSVLIEAPLASFRLERDARIRVDGGTTPPEAIRRYIERTEDVDCQDSSVDFGLFEMRTGSDRRFSERRLDVGAEVHVLGTARYDTTVSKNAGEVNAVVGEDEAVFSESRWERLRYRLLGYPFVVSDRSERALGLQAATYGLLSILAGVVVLAVATVFLA
ncbi:E3 ubiquitin ligase family protein [Natronobiforma cellulositropha]|uniref:E3 ubiquitin ligase family protein n=1 Tax=Natronobiforma cellulositropha TaxID=1679076 RepID=UPI0021D5E8FD|nr:E3 ubiquitin ligase family protein [Natronobiforma cellulositropha]